MLGFRGLSLATSGPSARLSERLGVVLRSRRIISARARTVYAIPEPKPYTLNPKP